MPFYGFDVDFEDHDSFVGYAKDIKELKRMLLDAASDMIKDADVLPFEKNIVELTREEVKKLGISEKDIESLKESLVFPIGIPAFRLRAGVKVFGEFIREWQEIKKRKLKRMKEVF